MSIGRLVCCSLRKRSDRHTSNATSAIMRRILTFKSPQHPRLATPTASSFVAVARPSAHEDDRPTLPFPWPLLAAALPTFTLALIPATLKSAFPWKIRLSEYAITSCFLIRVSRTRSASATATRASSNLSIPRYIAAAVSQRHTCRSYTRKRKRDGKTDMLGESGNCLRLAVCPPRGVTRRSKVKADTFANL